VPSHGAPQPVAVPDEDESDLEGMGRARPIVCVLPMLAIQIASPVGPLPPSPATVAGSGLGAYLVFAVVAGWMMESGGRWRAVARAVG
jgi:hypothetical protein